jgi:hypothetical protein
VRFDQYAVFVETAFAETAKVIRAKFTGSTRLDGARVAPNFRRGA